MVFGHLTVTAALHREARRRWTGFPLALGPLVFGAYLPDLIDKPLNMLFRLSGHGFGHSLVMQVVFFGVLLLCWRSRRLLVATVGIGAALHLIEDAEGWTELLAPLLGPIPQAPFYDVVESLVRFYTTSSPLLWIEVAAALYWLTAGGALWWSRSRGRGLTARESV